MNLQDIIKRLTPEYIESFILERTFYPQDAANMFVETSNDASTSNQLLELYIVTGINHKKGFFQYVGKNANNSDFISSIEKVWKARNGEWKINALNMAGQCVLEAGYAKENPMVSQYQKSIGCDSIFSKAFDIHKVPEKIQPMIQKKNFRYGKAGVKEAGNLIYECVMLRNNIIKGKVEKDTRGNYVIIKDQD